MPDGIDPAMETLQTPERGPLQNRIDGIAEVKQLKHRHHAVLLGRKVLQGPKRGWRSSFCGHMPR